MTTLYKNTRGPSHMKRYIIVTRKAGIYDGIYFGRSFAEQSINSVRDAWPGLEWEIEEIDCGLPVPGLMHMGRVRAPRILKHHMKTLEGCE